MKRSITFLLLLFPLLLHAQTNLRKLSSTGGAASFQIAHHRGFLYSGEGYTFRVYDARTVPPYAKVFEHRFNGVVDEIQVQGNDLWVAASMDGVSKWDVTNPGNPVLEAASPPPAYDNGYYDVAVKGDSVFVATRQGLSLFKVNGASIDLLQTVYTVTNANAKVRGCAIHGNTVAFCVGTYAFTPSPFDGIYLYDASNLNPLGLFYQPYCDPEDVLFSPDGLVLHVMGGGEFTSKGWLDTQGLYYALDISNPALPRMFYSDTLTSLGLLGETQVITGELVGTTLFLTTRVGDSANANPGRGFVATYNVADTANYQRMTSIPVGLLHFDQCHQGDTMHVASEWFGIRTLTGANLLSPDQYVDTRTGGWLKWVDVYGDRMVQANEGYGVALYDISNPASPQRMATYDNVGQGFCYGVCFSPDGTKVYAFYLQNLFNTYTDFRVLDGDSLYEIGGSYQWGGYEYAAAYGNYALALGNSQLRVMDVSDQQAPDLLAIPAISATHMVVTAQGKALLSDGDSLLVVDINQGFARVGGIRPDNQVFEALAFHSDTLYAWHGARVERYLWNNAANTFTLAGFFQPQYGEPAYMAADRFGLYLGYHNRALSAYDHASFARVDTFRTGLDFYLLLADDWGFRGLKAVDGFVYAMEYYGQTTILTLDDGFVGLEEKLEKPAQPAWPNPIASGEAIHIPMGRPAVGVNLEIVDASGRYLHFPWHLEGETLHVQTGQVAAGVYNYRVTAGAEIVARGKFILRAP